MRRSIKQMLLLVSVLMIALGFNTLDQMIIRYKYYDYWRSIEAWEMCHFWKPHWWDAYNFAIIMLTVGAVIIGYLLHEVKQE